MITFIQVVGTVLLIIVGVVMIVRLMYKSECQAKKALLDELFKEGKISKETYFEKTNK